MDRYLYERMLFNLLSNAIKFTPTKGQIHLRVAWSADQLTFSSPDSGIGISRERPGEPVSALPSGGGLFQPSL